MVESETNPATVTTGKISHDTIDTLVQMVVFFLTRGLVPFLWKRDISRAFRRLPILVAHLDVSWVVFVYAGNRLAAQHVGMPFGATSAVHAWHRAGAFLLTVVRRLCKAPAGRYVDDFFGVSKADVKIHGGRCLDFFARP